MWCNGVPAVRGGLDGLWNDVLRLLVRVFGLKVAVHGLCDGFPGMPKTGQVYLKFLLFRTGVDNVQDQCAPVLT